jgi:hypothetical protein
MFLMGEQKKKPNDKKTSLSIMRKGIRRCKWLFLSSYRVGYEWDEILHEWG